MGKEPNSAHCGRSNFIGTSCSVDEKAFIGKPVSMVEPASAGIKFNHAKINEVSWSMLIPMIILAVAIILLGLRLDWVLAEIKPASYNLGVG